jgi:hypothetical protein
MAPSILIAWGSARVILAVFFLLSTSVCGFIASAKFWELTVLVNEKLPERDRFLLMGWYWNKQQRVLKEYRRLYPDGRLDWEWKKFVFAMAILGFGAAISIGIIRL